MLSNSTQCAPLFSYSGLPPWTSRYYEEANLRASALLFPDSSSLLSPDLMHRQLQEGQPSQALG